MPAHRNQTTLLSTGADSGCGGGWVKTGPPISFAPAFRTGRPIEQRILLIGMTNAHPYPQEPDQSFFQWTFQNSVVRFFLSDPELRFNFRQSYFDISLIFVRTGRRRRHR